MSELDPANARREIEHLQRECGDLREFITAESKITGQWRDHIHLLRERLEEEIARVTRAEARIAAALVIAHQAQCDHPEEMTLPCPCRWCRILAALTGRTPA